LKKALKKPLTIIQKENRSGLTEQGAERLRITGDFVEKQFTHIDKGRVHMVDVTEKKNVPRLARARGEIILSEETTKKIKDGSIEKGNVLATARVAAVLAVKKTPDIIPMCHQIPITGIDVDFEMENEVISTVVEVRTIGKTGVEMEALTGVSAALLTIWDMVKSAEKDESGNYPNTSIRNIRVLEKHKGKYF
jgi:cyclic pyranopterin monophosphate synthase